MKGMTLQVEGLRWHDPISVVGAPSRSECYGVVAPPRIWGRGIRNAAHCTPPTAFPGLDRLLAAAAKVLEPLGALILDSTDLRDVGATAVDTDRDDGFEDDDRYIGELHYQLSVGEHVGDIFPQLFVDPDTLDTRARLAGWNTEVIWSGPGGRYLARLVSVTDDAAGQNRAVSETLA